MLGYYNYTVIATYISVLSALCGAFFCITGAPDLAVYCLLLSGVLDMFDGPIARTKQRDEQQSKFGIQIDSFSDFMAFGVLPAMILFSEWSISCGGLSGWKAAVATVSSAFVALAALIRLSYFNVAEEIRQEAEGGKRRTEFLGMPVTTIALILPAVYIVKPLLSLECMAYVLTAVLVIAGFLYISKIRFKKPDKKGMVVMAIIGSVEVVFILFGRSIIAALCA